MIQAPARSFRELLVWQKAHAFVLGVYQFSATFPPLERYGLAAQLRRSAVSVPANIAEGFKKRGRSDKARYMNIAEASLEEARYYLLLAQDLHYGDATRSLFRGEEVARLLAGYGRTLTARDGRPE